MKISFSSEWLKTKRAEYRYVIYSLPLIFNLLILIYLLLSKSTNDVSKVIQNYFSILVLALPFAFILLGSLIYQIDKDAGLYKNIIHSTKDAVHILNSKFMFYYFQLAIAYFSSMLISLLLIYYFTPILTSNLLLEFFKMFIQVWLFSHTMMVISNFISIVGSFIYSLVIGAFFTLMTAIIGMTGLGEGFWILCPFAWPFRFLFVFVEKWVLVLLWGIVPVLLYLISLKVIILFKLNK